MHLSAGDLLRAEQDRPNSQFGSMIREMIREGTIVPMEVTVRLLENAMEEVIKDRGGEKGEGKFLIDGLFFQSLIKPFPYYITQQTPPPLFPLPPSLPPSLPSL